MDEQINCDKRVNGPKESLTAKGFSSYFELCQDIFVDTNAKDDGYVEVPIE
jgi:hypothetical protein